MVDYFSFFHLDVSDHACCLEHVNNDTLECTNIILDLYLKVPRITVY